MLEQLKKLTLFSELNARDSSACELLLEQKTLQSGERLWLQGEPSEEMAFITAGTLDIQIADHVIATLSTGEMVGELAVFTRDQRTASVIGGADGAEIVCLSRSHLQTLGQVMPNLYDSILNVALEKSARRVHQMGKQIARLASGGASSPKRASDNALGRLWKRISGGSSQNPPPALSAIRKLPRMKNAPVQHLNGIIASMTPHHVDKGQALFLEGDVGESVYLLVEGCIEVMRNVGGDRAERLASLFPGALFGTGSLLLRERRNAACVASSNTQCWVYELHSDSYKSLKGVSGRLLRECLLVSLAFQLRTADDKLIELKTGQRPQQSDYDSIRSGLAGFQGREG